MAITGSNRGHRCGNSCGAVSRVDPGCPGSRWLARVQLGRDRVPLLGDSPDDDVADPMGGPAHGDVMTAALLDELVGALVDLCWGRPPRGLPGPP